MLYIGVDLGTSAVKLLLADGQGAVLKTVTREYPVFYPKPGWSEQNPEDWLRETVEGIRELTSDCNKWQIAGIGCAGQMHGLVVLDGEDQVIRPCILWNDGRTSEEVEELNGGSGKDDLRRMTANIAFAGFTAPKLLWMQKHEPEQFARIRRIMLPKDYLTYRLTGAFCTDVSDASGTLLFDVEHRCWNREMLERCGVEESQLPAVLESWEPAGTLKPEMAELLDLPETVKVCAGAGDNAAAAVGTGISGDGACNISLGTSGTIFISSSEFRADPDSALHAFAHADGHWHLMGCILSAASCCRWWAEEILGTKDLAGEQAPVTPEMLGRNHVFFLPYLMGERSPINDTDARGTFTGLTMDSTRADMMQAVLEGVAFAFRDCLEAAKSLGLEVRSSRICGGGARSPLWRTILANVLNIELEVPDTEEGPGRGGAILAAVCCGEQPSVPEACRTLTHTVETIRPDPEIAARYEQCYRKYRLLYPALKPVFPQLAAEN